MPTTKALKVTKVQLKTNAQLMYEIKGMTLTDIGKALGITRVTLGKWKKKGGWKERGEDLPEVVEMTRQKTIEMFAEQGMPPERAAGLMIEGMTQPREGRVVEQKFDRKQGKIVDKVAFKGHKDFKVRHKFQHDYMLMTGQIGGSSKMELNNNGTGTVNVMVNLPEKKDG